MYVVRPQFPFKIFIIYYFSDYIYCDFDLIHKNTNVLRLAYFYIKKT